MAELDVISLLITLTPFLYMIIPCSCIWKLKSTNDEMEPGRIPVAVTLIG